MVLSTLKNRAKLLFSTNKIPMVRDKSFGFYRSLILFPFDAVFSKDDPDYNPAIEQDVTTEAAMSYLLNVGIRGFRRLMKHGFTRPGKVEKALDTYKVESSNALRWVTEEGLKEADLLDKSTSELFYQFKTYCETEGMGLPRQQTFTTDIAKRFGFTLSKQIREPKSGRRVRFFLKNGENKNFVKIAESEVTT